MMQVDRSQQQQQQQNKFGSRKNYPSDLLTEEENRLIFHLFPTDSYSLCTCVSQLWYPRLMFNNFKKTEWEPQSLGVVCFVKDFLLRSYFIRFYSDNFELKLDQEIYEPFSFNKLGPKFFFFNGDHNGVALQFSSADEARLFHNHINLKIEKLQIKKNKNISQNHQHDQQEPKVHNLNEITNNNNNNNSNRTNDMNRMKNSKGFASLRSKNRNKKFSPKDIGLPHNFVHISSLTNLNTNKMDLTGEFLHGYISKVFGKEAPPEQIQNLVDTSLYSDLRRLLTKNPNIDRDQIYQSAMTYIQPQRSESQQSPLPESRKPPPPPLRPPVPLPPTVTHRQAPPPPPPPPPPIPTASMTMQNNFEKDYIEPMETISSFQTTSPQPLAPPPPPPFLPDEENSILPNVRAEATESSHVDVVHSSVEEDNGPVDLFAEIRQFNKRKLKTEEERPKIQEATIQPESSALPPSQQLMEHLISALKERHEAFQSEDDLDESDNSDFD